MIMFKNFTLNDLIRIALFATIATVSKVPLRMAANLFASTFGIPGGVVNGIYYMFWLIAAYGLVRKRGTATLFCIIQAALSLYLGVPALRLITYIPPGLAVDALYTLMNCEGHSRTCMTLGGAVANIAGTITVSLMFLKLPPAGLVAAALIAGFSGGMGGYLAYIVVRQLDVLIPGLNGVEKRC